MAPLTVQDVACQRGGRQILSGVSFQLAPGQLLQLTGSNGSGKTTLLRILAGLLPAGAGRIEGCEDFAYLGHLDGFKAALTGRENLQLGIGLAAREVTTDKVQSALRQVGLARQADVLVRHYSAGMRRRLALARLLVAVRKLWLLDEPLTSLDDAGQDLFVHMLQRHLADGGRAIIATHQQLAMPGAQQLHLGRG